MVADGLAPAYAGEVSVKRQADGNYHVVIDVYDDGGFNITGEWTGPIKCMFDVPAGIDDATAEVEYTFLDSETILLGNVTAKTQIDLYATDGTHVKHIDGKATISLSHLPKGIYIVKVDHKKSFKVVKK